MTRVFKPLAVAVARLDKSFNPLDTLRKLRKHVFTWSDAVYLLHIILASFWLTIMQSPSFPLKLIIPLLYTLALLIPFTSQFFIPATPIFAYLLSFYSARFIPTPWRPAISVSLLPTLESVLYGANISDILTRFTHPVLDLVAWVPYGVGHYLSPFLVAALLWLLRPPPALRIFAHAFGYLNLTGVLTQVLLPCAPPWYELLHGLTPANYAMHGSPGGLARIDALFHSNTYTAAFTSSPVPFGAFPSLHAACATIEAFFIARYFPAYKVWAWAYAGVLYWATMYLTHHYLIDVVGGACLATAFFYLFVPDVGSAPATPDRGKYEMLDVERV
ncbi:Aureobasidin resistance protein Aur1 [Pleurotus pulmonarius]|nr:Aureobasidin resistance protein Aur1 [Pleurotus pulmonarius]KAF4599325.1 Aureobasidin resistance protein Aur1 [Pleurotus pulmonarius]